MRKCLGVLAGVVVLCMMSWAQAPPSAPTPAPPSDQTSAPPSAQAPTAPSTPTPAEPTSSSVPVVRPPAGPTYPRFELFGGYSHAQTGFFNAGHWADLNGWNASFDINAASWFGFIFDGSEYFGTSKIPIGTQEPFPPCPPFCPVGGTGSTFNVDTREYNFLVGAQFAYRKRPGWTPFGDLMFGHDGVRGIAIAQNLENIQINSGLALLAGGGADRNLSQRFAVRFRVDYLATRTDFPLLGKKKQDNLRFSVGVVIRSVRKKRRRLEEETAPEP